MASMLSIVPRVLLSNWQRRVFWARPDLVKQFLEKEKQEGLFKTSAEARWRMYSTVFLGYSDFGVVIAVGDSGTVAEELGYNLFG